MDQTKAFPVSYLVVAEVIAAIGCIILLVGLEPDLAVAVGVTPTAAQLQLCLYLGASLMAIGSTIVLKILMLNSK